MISVLEEWDQVLEVWNKLEYVIPGAALVIGMNGSFRGHVILLGDLHGNRNTWIQVMREKVMLDHTSSLDLWKYSKVKREKGIT